LINILFKSIWKRLSYLEIHDVTNQVFLIFLSIISTINHRLIPDWGIILATNLLLAVLIIQIVFIYESKNEIDKRLPGIVRFLRYWYPVFMIFFCFKEIYYVMVGLTPILYDSKLIQIDYYIFGLNPTVELRAISNPLLTEFLQLIYTLFYIMPVIFGLELYLWHRYREFKKATFVIFFGFYMSFIGYLILPAIGPRFILHDFYNINSELPGILVADFLRDIINLGESIPSGSRVAETIAQRDAFPSGHTTIILLITYLSKKNKSNSFYFYLPYSVVMIFSTVYLRYHYVIDIIGGVIFALMTIIITGILYSVKWNRNNISEIS
jgi:membrane-associated phospholipid phosphatase